MNEVNCPLCNGISSPKESIPSVEIIKLWQKISIDVKDIIRSDYTEYICNECNLGFFSPEYIGDNYFYGKLSEFEWYYNHDGKTEYSIVSDMLKSSGDKKLLDIGCGTGEFSKYLPTNINYMGVDTSSVSIRKGQDMGRNVFFLNIQDEESKLGKFDIITCFQVKKYMKI